MLRDHRWETDKRLSALVSACGRVQIQATCLARVMLRDDVSNRFKGGKVFGMFVFFAIPKDPSTL